MGALQNIVDRVMLGTDVDTTHYRNGQPFHIHTGPKSGKRWACSSPYCEYMDVEMPENGGPLVVHKGLEPWRGR